MIRATAVLATLVFAAGLIWLWVPQAAGRAAMAPLERRFPPAPLGDLAACDTIIVLAGDYERAKAGARLASALPQARLVFVDTPIEALRGMAYAERLGVSPARMLVEPLSQTTWENALFARALLAPAAGRPHVLVTSAYHMPRAVGAFRRAGFTVAPWPVYGAEYPQTRFSLRLALHEWGGLIVYWILGRTDQAFPAPDPPSATAVDKPAPDGHSIAA